LDCVVFWTCLVRVPLFRGELEGGKGSSSSLQVSSFRQDILSFFCFAITSFTSLREREVDHFTCFLLWIFDFELGDLFVPQTLRRLCPPARELLHRRKHRELRGNRRLPAVRCARLRSRALSDFSFFILFFLTEFL
jgi:hypothetical protein